MFFIYLIIFKIIVNKYLSLKLGSHFSHEDCYESLTVPKINFKLFHYYPSGPKLLEISFETRIEYSNKTLPYYKLLITHYFKKINELCESSLIFSTQKMEIYLMDIIIKIYFVTQIPEAVYTKLRFKHGFKQGEYIFMDKNSHFGIPAKVIYSNKQFIPMLHDIDLNAMNFYFDSLTINKKAICVLTENNRQVVIRPSYHNMIYKGLIVAIQPMLEKFEVLFQNLGYQAFDCSVSKENRYETTAFIVDKYQKSPITFIAIYAKWDGAKFSRYAAVFSLNNYKLYQINFFSILPPNINKVFLVKKTQEFIKYQEFQTLEIFKSNTTIIYHAQELVYIEVMPDVKREKMVIYSPLTLYMPNK